MRTLAIAAMFLGTVFGQSTDSAPRFEIADVHVAVKGENYRATPPRGGRFEMKGATMLDLIATSYSFERDRVLGGPSWLELDKFDVVAKMGDEPPDVRRQMMQQLLADRFKLVVHKDTKPLPVYVLTVGKKVQLKEGDGTGETGCKPESGSPGQPGDGGTTLTTMSGNGPATTIHLGPGMVITFHCRNMTMTGFADGLRGMMGAFQAIGTLPIKDETGLEGRFNFDVRWSMTLMGPAMMNQGDRIGVFEALDKQLGLKLEQRPEPTQVLIVDSVNRKPSENPPGVAEALPPIPIPTEFEVADVKPSDPESKMGRFQIQPGGRLVAQNMGIRFLVNRAFATNNNDAVTGIPAWADSARFDITAKAPSVGGVALGPGDMDAVAPMMLALLKDRFKLTYHTEDKQVSAYRLVAGKVKMKKADPESRTSCKQPTTLPPGTPPGAQVLVCTNATMALFAERLQNMSPELSWPVLDSTGLERGYDFTLAFTPNFGGMMMAPRPVGGDGGPAGGMAMPADPQGGTTIFEAIEKQLGLKLEVQKRTMPVVVIDHLEQKPTEN